MSQPNVKKDSVPSEVRVVVEVNGNPVGFLNLDVGRLWPIINHRKNDNVPVEWMDGTKFDSIMRAKIALERAVHHHFPGDRFRSYEGHLSQSHAMAADGK